MVPTVVQSQLFHRNTWLHNHDGNFYGILPLFWSQTSCMDGYWNYDDVLCIVLWCHGSRCGRNYYRKNGFWNRGNEQLKFLQFYTGQGIT